MAVRLEMDILFIGQTFEIIKISRLYYKEYFVLLVYNSKRANPEKCTNAPIYAEKALSKNLL